MKLTVGCVNEKVENKGGDWGQYRRENQLNILYWGRMIEALFGKLFIIYFKITYTLVFLIPSHNLQIITKILLYTGKHIMWVMFYKISIWNKFGR